MIEAGVQMPNISGTNGSAFDSLTGFHARTALKQPQLLPNSTVVVGLRYQPLRLKGVSNSLFQFVDVFAGLKFGAADKASSLITPEVAIHIGASNGMLSFTNSNSTQNSRLYFMAEVFPDLAVHVTGPVSLILATPVRWVFSKPMLSSWATSIGVRYSL